MSNLGIKERHVGSVTILDAVGRLRIGLRFGGSSVTLADAIVALLASGHKNILLNLDGVHVLGAKELGDLVWICLETRKGGGEFKLFNLTTATRQLMQSTKLLTVLDVYESEDQAIQSFRDNQNVTLEINVAASNIGA
ncbi:MAG TPA: STAS domain-containing protein [Pyrinomonadaceae bacterium]|nr:STAS domain-containing protein [Pyrinomonadaceae bacterium]